VGEKVARKGRRIAAARFAGLCGLFDDGAGLAGRWVEVRLDAVALAACPRV